jgi:hypothetical protein
MKTGSARGSGYPIRTPVIDLIEIAALSGTLRSLRAFDLFPQTAHVETVAELACATT